MNLREKTPKRYGKDRRVESTGSFAAKIAAEMILQNRSINDVRDAGKICYEHARKLVRGDAVPSRPVADNICQLLHLDAEEMWQRAQKDRFVRKYGSTLVASAQQLDPRLAQFEKLILALTPDQVPAALAMLRGLVSTSD